MLQSFFHGKRVYNQYTMRYIVNGNGLQHRLCYRKYCIIIKRSFKGVEVVELLYTLLNSSYHYYNNITFVM